MVQGSPRLYVRDRPRPGSRPEPFCPQSRPAGLPLTLWLLEPHQRALALLHRSYGLRRQSKSLPLTSVVPAQRLFVAPRRDCQSLLGDGPCRHYLRYPCMGAWSLTPPHSFGARARFFPKSSGLTPGQTGSERETTAAMQLQRRRDFRNCSHCVMSRLPYLLDHQVAATAVAQRQQSSRTD
jgi:hypothetical protein